MAKIFIIGAAGKVGRRLTQQLTARGHQPLTLYRKAEQADELKKSGATPVAGDLTQLSPKQLGKLMNGSDAIVFTAGAGGAGIEVTKAIDGAGLELAVEAAHIAGVKRFILISVFPDALRDGERSEGFENYIRVKKLSDAHLVATDLDWVIIRPGTLLEDRGTGKVRADVAIPYGEISRDDVATVLVELLEQPTVNRMIIELTSGEVSIAEAVRKLTLENR